jgi:hypothetical protein
VILPTFFRGSATSFDLASTLPGGLQTGGTFGVSSTGLPLPPGMTLSAAGVLSVGSAAVAVAAGVVFTYAEPGG